MCDRQCVKSEWLVCKRQSPICSLKSKMLILKRFSLLWVRDFARSTHSTLKISYLMHISSKTPCDVSIGCGTAMWVAHSSRSAVALSAILICLRIRFKIAYCSKSKLLILLCTSPICVGGTLASNRFFWPCGWRWVN